MKIAILLIFFYFVNTFIYPQEVPFEQLNLTGSALYAATKIKEKFPKVIFTSGTRTLDSQAKAVAQNIYRTQNSGWVGATYRDSVFIRKLNQEIINNWNAIKGSESLILQTVNKVFSSDNAGARSMSKHLTGYAFDIRVNCVNYNELNNFLKTLPDFHQFLTQEGGLAVWHIEFNEAPIPPNNNTSQKNNIIRNNSDGLVGTKWEHEFKTAGYYSVKKRVLQFYNKSQARIIDYFGDGTIEDKHGYEYNYDPQNKRWVLIQTVNGYGLQPNTMLHYITVTNNELYFSNNFGTDIYERLE
jgi:hypothetical protein